MFKKLAIYLDLNNVLLILYISGRTIPAQAIISNVVNSERRGSFMSINSSVQQISLGLASVIAGLVVIKTPTNALANHEITGYISIAVRL